MKKQEIMVSGTDALNMEEEERENFDRFFQMMAQLVTKYGKGILEQTDRTA